MIEGYNPNRERGVVASADVTAATLPAPAYDETFGSWLEQQLALLRDQFQSFGT